MALPLVGVAAKAGKVLTGKVAAGATAGWMAKEVTDSWSEGEDALTGSSETTLQDYPSLPDPEEREAPVQITQGAGFGTVALFAGAAAVATGMILRR